MEGLSPQLGTAAAERRASRSTAAAQHGGKQFSFLSFLSGVKKIPFRGRKAVTASPAHKTESGAGAAAGRGQYGVMVFLSHLHGVCHSPAEEGTAFTPVVHFPVRACSDFILSRKRTEYPGSSAEP